MILFKRSWNKFNKRNKTRQRQSLYREDNYEGMKRVELHAHTQMSELDSVMSVSDYLSMAKSGDILPLP